MTLMEGLLVALISCAVTLFVTATATAIAVVWMQEEARRQWSRRSRCGQDACRKGCHSVPELAEPALGVFKGGR
jgi:hypothetical protein